ncbi:MAG TPA: hypothetical protein VGV69_10195, partial [Solirubrobacterales bacterium]|nr:hypothetical protein [Solirubrobacterales bacterium]
MRGTIERLRGDLDRSLFRPSEDRRRFGRGEGAVLLVAFLALATVLQLFRVGPGEALDSLWAEDGPIFLADAQDRGFLDALVSPYAGYLVLVQRLVAEVGAAVPLPDAAAAVALTSCLVIALSGLVVWFAAAGHIRSPFLRGLLVALTVLCPVAGLEAVVSGTYASWYMLFACFWLLLWRPATTWGAALGGLFILVTGLSNPGIFFFAPLALLRGLAARDRRDALIAGAFALVVAIQLPVTALSEESTIDPFWSEKIGTAYLQRVVDGSVLGEQLAGSAWEQWGWPFLIALSLGVALFLIVTAVRSHAHRLLAAIAVGTSVVMFAVSAYQRAVGEVLAWPADTSLG